MSDTFERALLRLDEIDSLDVRTERKRAVRFVDALAERVEDIKRRFGHELSIDYIFEELYLSIRQHLRKLYLSIDYDLRRAL